MSKLQNFSWEYLNSLFVYDEDTGFIVRKTTRSHNAKAGDIVGTVDGKGYLHVVVDRKFIRLHRLAYFLKTREVPKEVDHIDRDPKNNAWSNLRACCRRTNLGNTRNKNNTSGFKGVCFHKRSGKWLAQIKRNKKTKYLGLHDTPEAAAQAYALAAEKHFGVEYALHDGGSLGN